MHRARRHRPRPARMHRARRHRPRPARMHRSGMHGPPRRIPRRMRARPRVRAIRMRTRGRRAVRSHRAVRARLGPRRPGHRRVRHRAVGRGRGRHVRRLTGHGWMRGTHGRTGRRPGPSRFALGRLELGQPLEEHVCLLREHALHLHRAHDLVERGLQSLVDLGEAQPQQVAAPRALAPNHHRRQVERMPAEVRLHERPLARSRRLRAEHQQPAVAQIHALTPHHAARHVDDGVTAYDDPRRRAPVVDDPQMSSLPPRGNAS